MAKRREVLLIKDVLKLGNMGDVVRVSPGFARNYLYPFGMAVPAEGAAKRQIEVLRDKAAKSEADRETKALALRKSMEGMTIQVAARVAHELELFGSIGTRELVAALATSGIEIDGKQIHLNDKIRRLGVYSVEIRLHKNVPVTVKLEVVNSDPNAPSLQETLAQVAADRAAAAQRAADAKAAGKSEKADKPEDEAKAEKPEKADKPEKAEKPEKGEKQEKGGPEKGEQEKAESGKAGKGAKDEARGGKKDKGNGASDAAAKKTVKA